jgi:pilus assembly protein CpaE
VQTSSEYLTRRALLDFLKASDPKICFLDCISSFDNAMAVMQEMHTHMPHVAVVALLKGNDSDLILRCLRGGASDFLIRPFTEDQMNAAIEKIARLIAVPSNRPSGGATTIGIFPAKGACGATTIAYNLAFQSKRQGSKRTLLADLDPLTGTISFLLKLKSPFSFVDVLGRQGELDGDLWKQMIASTQGIDVLLSPENVIDGFDDAYESDRILAFAQSLYDTIVIDCGDSYSHWNISIANMCDEVVLTTSNELPSLQAAQKVLAHFDLNGISKSKIRLVVNRYQAELGLSSDLIAAALQTEVFQVIPSDYESIQKSMMEGKPVPSNTPFGKSISALGDKLGAGRPAKDLTKKPTSSSITQGLKSIFSRASS